MIYITEFYAIIPIIGLARLTYCQARPQIGNSYFLDGIVTVVDAQNITKRLQDKSDEGGPGEAVRQIAYADRIILNKTDLVSSEEQEVVADKISGINSLAEVQPTERSKVTMDYVLGVGGFDLARVGDQVKQSTDKVEQQAKKKSSCCSSKKESEVEPSRAHNSQVMSLSVVIDKPLDMDKINYFIDAIVTVKSLDLYRMKGFL